MNNVTELRHKFDGLNGTRCNLQYDPSMTVKAGLSWDTVTCPECLALKRPTEPASIDIDTKGD